MIHQENSLRTTTFPLCLTFPLNSLSSFKNVSTQSSSPFLLSSLYPFPSFGSEYLAYTVLFPAIYLSEYFFPLAKKEYIGGSFTAEMEREKECLIE